MIKDRYIWAFFLSFILCNHLVARQSLLNKPGSDSCVAAPETEGPSPLSAIGMLQPEDIAAALNERLNESPGADTEFLTPSKQDCSASGKEGLYFPVYLLVRSLRI